jgi:hypothetical protein
MRGTLERSGLSWGGDFLLVKTPPGVCFSEFKLLWDVQVSPGNGRGDGEQRDKGKTVEGLEGEGSQFKEPQPHAWC